MCRASSTGQDSCAPSFPSSTSQGGRLWLPAGPAPQEDNQKMSTPCEGSPFPCRRRSWSHKPEVLGQGEGRRPAAPGQERDTISPPSFSELRDAANKGKQIMKAIPADHSLGWWPGSARGQHEAVLLEGYSLGSVGEQGSAHIVEGPEAEGRTRSWLWASPGNPAFFGDSNETHPATLLFVLEKTQKARRKLPECFGNWLPTALIFASLYSCPSGRCSVTGNRKCN